MNTYRKIKKCCVCKQCKTLEQFHRDRRSKDGHSYACKPCAIKKSHEAYERKVARDGITKRNTKPLTVDEKEKVRQTGRLTCRKCGIEKELSEFGSRFRNGSLRPIRLCKDCVREQREAWDERDRKRIANRSLRHRCKNYGLTVETYLSMLERQGHRCVICRRPLDKKWQTIDHDHVTGKVRGIVHRHCNLIIGNSNDDPEILHEAIRYLEEHKSRLTS